MSYAIKLGIERLTNDIRMGSHVSKEAFPPAKLVDTVSFKKFLSSFKAFSWFSKMIVVTARL